MATETSHLLPYELRSVTPKPSRHTRLVFICTIISIVVIAVWFFYSRPLLKKVDFELVRGDNIQLMSEKYNLFVRTDPLEMGIMTLTEDIPWLHGSTFEQFTTGNGCFALKALSGDWLVLNRETDTISPKAADGAHATEFEIVYLTSSTYFNQNNRNKGQSAKIKVCKEDLWWEVVQTGNSGSLDAAVPYLTILALRRPELGHTAKLLGSSVQSHAVALENVFCVQKVEPIHGVNLGGWFIPEIWMNPSFSNYTGLHWAGSLCNVVKYNRTLAEEHMQAHLASWMQEADFQAIAENGFNSVRVPVGYWNVIPDPHRRFVPEDVSVSLSYLDWVFTMCAKYSLSVLLDLHGAPGSQNGVDHSGCGMPIDWLESAANADLTIDALDAMMQRYGHRAELLGIELVNEPAVEYCRGAMLDRLKSFYRRAYGTVRKHSRTAMIVFNELYTECYSAWTDELQEPQYYNVVMDLHLYNWQEPYTSEPAAQHVANAVAFEKVIQKQSQHHPVIVGEWCFSTGVVVQAGQPFVDACVESFRSGLGWYIWNWKVERGIHFDEWDVQLQYEMKDGLRV